MNVETDKTDHYASKLLSQAIADPAVNSLDGDEMKEYIIEQTNILCLTQEQAQAVLDKVIRSYHFMTTDNIKRATELSTDPSVEV